MPSSLLPCVLLGCRDIEGSVYGFSASCTCSMSAEQLREDINASTVIIALLTRESLSSGWVLIELGASWALMKETIPILAPGLAYDDLPGPLAGYPCIRIDSQDAGSKLRAAITKISSVLRVREKTGGRVQEKFDEFIKTLNSRNYTQSPVEIP